jgi:hypothetical protein
LFYQVDIPSRLFRTVERHESLSLQNGSKFVCSRVAPEILCSYVNPGGQQNLWQTRLLFKPLRHSGRLREMKDKSMPHVALHGDTTGSRCHLQNRTYWVADDKSEGSILYKYGMKDDLIFGIKLHLDLQDGMRGTVQPHLEILPLDENRCTLLESVTVDKAEQATFKSVRSDSVGAIVTIDAHIWRLTAQVRHQLQHTGSTMLCLRISFKQIHVRI